MSQRIISQKSPSIKVETTGELLTSYAGLVPFITAFRGSEAIADAIKVLSHLKKRDRGFSVEEKILSTIAHAYSGARTLDDMDKLCDDKALSMATGVRFMRPNTYGEFLRQHGVNELAQIESFIERSALQHYRKNAIEEEIFDADSSVFENDKKCAAYSYMKVPGFNPMFIIGANERIAVHAKFRNGNASPAADILEPLARVFTTFKHLKKIYFRGDSAFYQEKIMDMCAKDPRCRFTITVRQNSGFAAEIDAISEWEPYANEKDVEIAETTGMCVDHAYRMVVKRTRITREEENQPELFNDGTWKYYAIATNFSDTEKTMEEIIEFHNGRSNAENVFKEVKNDFELSHFPCIALEANAAYFYWRVIAFNLFRMVMNNGKLFPASWRRHFLGTILFRVIHLAGKVTRHANMITLRIYRRYRYCAEFFTAMELCRSDVL